MPCEYIISPRDEKPAHAAGVAAKRLVSTFYVP
jgi:hypothetical protein